MESCVSFLIIVRWLATRFPIAEGFSFTLFHTWPLRAFTCAHARNIYDFHWNMRSLEPSRVRVLLTIHDRARERQRKIPACTNAWRVGNNYSFYLLLNVRNMVEEKRKTNYFNLQVKENKVQDIYIVIYIYRKVTYRKIM